MRSLLTAFGVACLFSSARTGDELTFHPSEGASIRRILAQSGEYQLDEVSVVVDGQDMGQFLGAFEMTIEHQGSIEVADVFVALGKGRPLKLERSFEALSGSSSMSMSGPVTQAQDNSASSPLEGETVVFTWNEDDEDYEVTYSGGEGDEELLEGLIEDMDLRVLLPGEEVEPDGTWDVPIAALQSLAQPGGNLHMLPEGADVSAEDMKVFEDLLKDLQSNLSELLDGNCTCTYKGRRKIDEVSLSEIEIEIAIASTINLSGFVETIMEKVAEKAGEMPEMSIDTADLNLDFEGTGTLLWNHEAGRMHSFNMRGDITMGIDFAFSIEAEGESHSVDASLEMSGSLEQEYEIE